MNTLVEIGHLIGMVLTKTILQNGVIALLIWGLISFVLIIAPKLAAAKKYQLYFSGLIVLFIHFVYQVYTGFTALNASGLLQSNENFSVLTTTQVSTIGFWQNILNIKGLNLLIFAVYILGLLGLSFKLLFNIFQLKQVKASSIFPDNSLLKKFEALKLKLGIKQQVIFRLSNQINVPMMLGHMKPIVLVPAALLTKLSTDQLECLLLHELAHVKRQDYILHIFQKMMEHVLFFNPVVWLFSKYIHDNREIACDNLVVENIPNKVHYAEALFTVAQMQSKTTLAMAASGNKKYSLMDRIVNIVQGENNKSSFTPRPLTLVLVICLLGLGVVWPTIAQTPKSQVDKETSQQKEEPKATQVVVVANSTEEIDAEEEGQIDVAKIQRELKMASEELKNLPINEIKKEIEGINWNEIQASVSGALQEIAAVNWSEIADITSSATQIALVQTQKALDSVKYFVNDTVFNLKMIKAKSKEMQEQAKALRNQHAEERKKMREELDASRKELLASAKMRREEALQRRKEALNYRDEVIARNKEIRANHGNLANERNELNRMKDELRKEREEMKKELTQARKELEKMREDLMRK